MFGNTDPKLHDVPIGIDATGQRKEFDSMGTVGLRSAHGEHSARTNNQDGANYGQGSSRENAAIARATSVPRS